MLFGLILKGRVQGVGCRYYCAQVARKMKIQGNVTNLPDGSVRLIINCEDMETMKKFVSNLKNNRYGFNFYGTITGISVQKITEESCKKIRSDYSF